MRYITKTLKNERKGAITRLSESNNVTDYNLIEEREYVKEVESILYNSKFKSHYKGYEYIVDACRILYLYRFENILITKDIYARLANMYGTNQCQVEHAIRTAIKYSWNSFDNDQNTSEAYKEFKEKPTNREFIYSLSKLAFRSVGRV